MISPPILPFHDIISVMERAFLKRAGTVREHHGLERTRLLDFLWIWNLR